MANVNQPDGCVTPAVYDAMKQSLVGKSATDKISFYGATSIAQRSSAALSATNSLFAMTGASFVAQTSTSLSGFLVLNTTLASQLFDWIIEVRTLLVNLGLHKGGA